MPGRRIPPTVLTHTEDTPLPLDQPTLAPPPRRRRGGAKPDYPGDDWPGFDFWWALWKR